MSGNPLLQWTFMSVGEQIKILSALTPGSSSFGSPAALSFEGHVQITSGTSKAAWVVIYKCQDQLVSQMIILPFMHKYIFGRKLIKTKGTMLLYF